MSRRIEIVDAFEAVLSQGDEVLVIHSSLVGLGFAPRGLKWDLLGALSRLLAQGRTLALPTFTFGFCRGKPYHFRRTRGETGQLGHWFLELTASARTPHPIYSFAVAGPRAAELAAAANSTALGDDSIFALFERFDARLVMAGCDWNACTQFHRYEEQAQVSYRRYKTFSGSADFGDGVVQASTRMYVREGELQPVNDFTPAVSALRSAGLIAAHPLAKGWLQAVSCRSLAAACRERLAQDPMAFVLRDRAIQEQPRDAVAPAFPEVPSCTDRERRFEQGLPPLRIALLGQANLELLRSALLKSARELLPDRELHVYAPAFGQWYQEMLLPDSGLNRFQADVSIAVDRLEDVLQVESLDELRDRASVPDKANLPDRAHLDARFEHYLDLLDSHARGRPGGLFVNTFVPMRPSALGTGTRDADSPAKVVAGFNTRLEALLEKLPNARAFDLAGSAVAFRDGPLFDPRLWHLARFPYSAPFSDYLARRYLGWLMALQGRTSRLVVLDLDNTLWGGVLSEDGLAGLQLGGEYPGNAFAGFQRCLKRLARRGVALAVCSKNDAGEALHAIQTLPAMVLRDDDFAAWRINWEPKWRNIESLASELNLALEHVLFVDDNPTEREEVRRRLPTVSVLELPADPACYADRLLSSPYLECVTLTDEDRLRGRSYQSRRAARGRRREFERVEDFYASLESRIHIQPLDAGNAGRAEQLAQKTNQFNATGRRYTRPELEALAAENPGVAAQSADVFVIGLEDRFSERENVGLLIVRWRRPRPAAVEIDNLLLSCRVLGRGIERGVLGWLCREAARRGQSEIVGRIVPTPRNAPVRSLYHDHGFKPGEANGEWRLDLRKATADVPDWLTVVD
ncbi:MAG TPA: HAD-IIIC family phosphatase [Pirellulales bacterium]|nr:HAD-IIIC family phosphatase [Pirellulales bacterium]